MRRNKPKRFVEIYFVLYLAALVLLIPDKKHEDRQATSLISSLLQSSFTLQPEHTVLMCRVVRTSDQSLVLNCDSLNTIYHSGSVRDVRYEFSIEDQSYRNSVQLSSSQNVSASYFHIKGHGDEGSVLFSWKPPVAEHKNRLFRVKVKASGVPILPNGLSEEQRKYLDELMSDEGGLRLTAETQFTVALIYVDGNGSTPMTELNQQVLAQSDSSFRQRYQDLLAELEKPRFIPAPLGEFSLQPREKIVKMISYQPFENHIRVYGADPQREVDEIRLSGGSASYRFEGADIVVSGTTPPDGMAVYTLSARRISDKKDTSVSFRVLALSLDAPTVPQRMYPGISYTFAPNLPNVSGIPAGASLRDDRGNEVISSVQGESFVFRPSVDDTSRVFSFERSLNSRKIGQTLSIPVIAFPAPEILDISRQNGQIWVRTRSFGLENDVRSRVKLELSPALNTKVQERLGDYNYDAKFNVHLQVFQFNTQQSSISLRAMNGYKKASERREYTVRD